MPLRNWEWLFRFGDHLSGQFVDQLRDMDEQLNNIAPDGSISVTDGITTVDPASSLDFTSGATVTDGGSGVAQVAVNGGSQPFELVRVRLAFDTADLTFPGPGIVIYTPTARDRVLAGISAPIILTGWNGTGSATLYFFSQGDIYTAGVDSVSIQGPIAPPLGNIITGTIGTVESWQFLDTTPLMVKVDDGSGGDPEATAGEIDLVLVVVPAP